MKGNDLSKDSKKPSRKADPFALHGVLRWLFALGAFGFVSLALYLVFFDRDTGEAIVIAFLALGLLMGISAISARLPSALGFGGASATYSPATAALNESQDATPDDKRRLADELVSEVSTPAESRLRAEAAAVIRLEASLEDEVVAELMTIEGISVSTEPSDVRVSTPGKGAPMRLDAVITRNERRWAVEINNPSLSSGYMGPIERLTRALEHGEFVGGLLITPRGAGLERLVGSRRIRVIEVDQLAEKLPAQLDD